MRRSRKQRSIDFKQTFGTPHGRRALYDILEWCHVFRTSFVPGSGSSTVVFKEGERNIGLRILSVLKMKTMEEIDELQAEAEGTIEES